MVRVVLCEFAGTYDNCAFENVLFFYVSNLGGVDWYFHIGRVDIPWTTHTLTAETTSPTQSSVKTPCEHRDHQHRDTGPQQLPPLSLFSRPLPAGRLSLPPTACGTCSPADIHPFPKHLPPAALGPPAKNSSLFLTVGSLVFGGIHFFWECWCYQHLGDNGLVSEWLLLMAHKQEALVCTWR